MHDRQRLDADVAGWLSRVAAALKDEALFDPGYGPFYISGVSFGFGGDDTGFRLIPSDAEDGFYIEVGGPDA